jgi:tRNA1Val (adenine37-N6)-methyltransferase
MGNDYFRFKEFTIHQTRCAMRVTTDACILGAWVAREIPTAGRVLDIGSGTGLLMLMMAQQMPASFTGVELDDAAHLESRLNIDHSHWAERITVMKEDIRLFTSDVSYDLIVSNPPFYQDDLRRSGTAENLAMHGSELTLPDLAAAVDRLLTGVGQAVFLLPPHRMEVLSNLMREVGLYEKNTLSVRHSRNHAMLRKITVFSRKHFEEPGMEILDIRESDGAYTDDFRALMRPYYLFL